MMEVIDRLGIPVVTGWNSQDAIYDSHPLYTGRAGNMGDRPGNFAVQNSDLVFSCGASRLSIRQVGYNYETWARAAYVIVNDVDAEELKKAVYIYHDRSSISTKLNRKIHKADVHKDGSKKEKAKEALPTEGSFDFSFYVHE